MRLFHQILAEAAHRRGNTALALLAVTCAVALTVAFAATGEAAQAETRRTMRDMGYNLRIIPAAADMARFWERGYSEETMPEAGVDSFAAARDITYNHLIAMLVRRVEWDGVPVLLTGIASEVAPVGKEKPPLLEPVPDGALQIGAEVARLRGVEEGATVELLGRAFTVERVLAEAGTEDDVRVWTSLADAQALLGLEGRVNEIQALDCYCADPDVDNAARLREELETLLPEGRVLRMEAAAEAREAQRRMSEHYFALVLPWILLACTVWIGALAALNVRQRRPELGLLRALGHGAGRIAALVLGKAALLGAAGGAVGFALGAAATEVLAPGVFPQTAHLMRVPWELLAPALVGAPLLAALASLIPAGLAVAQDPAQTLLEDVA